MKLFNKFEINMNGKNKHKLVAVGYAGAICLAFLLSITRNNVNASVSQVSAIKDIEFIEDYNMDAEAEGYNDANLKLLENLRALTSTQVDEGAEVENLINKITLKEVEVEKGDNFISILTKKVGLEYNEAHKVVTSYKKVFDPRTLRIGQKIRFDVIYDGEGTLVSLEKIIIEPSIGKKLILSKNLENEYVAETEIEELIDEVITASGTIEGTLSSAMSEAGIPSQISASFINIFSFTVDFRREVRAGDSFEIIYENKINSEGKTVKSGDILYASIKLRSATLSLYRFEDNKGIIDYYDEKGMALKRTLHRKPLAFQNARISSPFGRRRHPIYKDLRIHWGVDYAAPRGTAIFAAGDGLVQVAKYNGGYGNYVKIRHNSEYSTAYGHMHRFASGIKPGVRVKQGQIIGYVGNTGRSTGPHLHYEVVQNGKRVNPTSIKAATGENLKGQNLENFKKVIAELKSNHTNMFAKTATEETQVATKE